MNKLVKNVSVIIPTYNRAELLELTLLSLYKQSVSSDAYEVIVVNDNSKDNTAKLLEKMKPPFELRVLNNEVNRGAAYSRNRGVKASKGRVIIFLDEMLVGRDFIKGHLRYHERDKMVINTHCNGQKIFSHYYPKFSKKQERKCERTTMQTSSTCKPMKKKGVVRLLSKEEVIDHSGLKHGYEISSWYDRLQKVYGKNLEEMATPWFLFITNGISLSRELIEEAGLFDEKLRTWMEDWELGYRLHLAGASFYNAKEIACYHQNHPIGRGTEDKLKSYLYFSEKHPTIEVLLVPAMSVVFYWNVVKLGKFITQYRELEKNHGDRYKELLEGVRILAETFRWHLQQTVDAKALPMLNSYKVGLKRWEPSLTKRVKEQLDKLEQDTALAGKYSELAKGFKDLLHLPIMKQR
ncbi:glycosyltransferase involved in cell wall biosynthesis [Desulfitispora alkaliphila]|uniref:glycosyltransferase family 2 protein n=1 Tax=Desulfitispora alkaliphila TaxID=622674 RepID=UPI003D243B14